MPKIAAVVPRVLVNGAASSQLSRDLTSLVVHVVEGHASVEIAFVSSLSVIDLNAADVESNRLEILLRDEEKFFSGELTAIETRLSPDAEQRTILFAEGVVLDGASQGSIPLRFGEGISWGSVRRHAGDWVVQGMCTSLHLRQNTRIDLVTNDPAFDGQFRVTQLWYRFDVASGTTVEFIATGQSA